MMRNFLFLWRDDANDSGVVALSQNFDVLHFSSHDYSVPTAVTSSRLALPAWPNLSAAHDRSIQNQS